MRAAVLALVIVAGCRPAPPRPLVIENRSPAERPQLTRRGAITEESVTQFLRARFARQLAAGTFELEWNGTTTDCLAEMEAMGWTDISHLAAAVPRDFEERAAITFDRTDPANIPGTLRRVMIIRDVRRYATDAWQHHWGSFARGDVEVYRAYGVDLAPMERAINGDGS